ncbi:hypothetical protein BTVI_15728 [Pitangus sulphuratus]|nr:hypothetical protein BTVI_15728 [Pitangus sulphuratus]
MLVASMMDSLPAKAKPVSNEDSTSVMRKRILLLQGPAPVPCYSFLLDFWDPAVLCRDSQPLFLSYQAYSTPARLNVSSPFEQIPTLLDSSTNSYARGGLLSICLVRHFYQSSPRALGKEKYRRVEQPICDIAGFTGIFSGGLNLLSVEKFQKVLDLANTVLIFGEAYGKKEEDDFVLFNISGDLLAETPDDPLSTQATLTPLHLAPDGLTFWLDFSAYLRYLGSSWRSQHTKYRAIYSRTQV